MRSEFTPGPARDHYHNTLGSEGEIGLQVVRRIGPIVIEHDSEPFRTQGDLSWFRMTELEDGVWVTKTAVHKLVVWNASSTVTAQITIDDDEGNVGEPVGGEYDIKGSDFIYGASNDYPVTGAGFPEATYITISGQSENAIVRGDGLSLWVLISSVGNAPTTGLIHAYALVAESAG